MFIFGFMAGGGHCSSYIKISHPACLLTSFESTGTGLFITLDNFILCRV